MKQVSITVIENGVVETISLSFAGDTMPTQLDKFIKQHIGGRPNDRK